MVSYSVFFATGQSVWCPGQCIAANWKALSGSLMTSQESFVGSQLQLEGSFFPDDHMGMEDEKAHVESV